ncbi:protoporphyrinogen oxidase [Enemella sp. A6]|uniref:protoporphyrinogen oxidase n=1 Tax=Enemella sp. A6 TaxID=3440152 RepID=UPI003EBC83D4
MAEGVSMGKRVVVIGAGVAGLVAAHRLATDTDAEVIVLEAADRAGGQLRTIDFLGLPIDVGAEALYLHYPVLKKIVDELGLADDLVPANTGTTLLAGEHKLRPMPAGVGPTGPTKLLPVLRSGILSPAGVIRAGREPLHTKHTLDTGDISVGEFLTRRFGREVVDKFVAPMLGNLHSGDIDRLSLRATAPQLVKAATEGTSLLRAKRPAGGGGPGFVSFPGGLRTFVDALAAGLDVRLGQGATSLEQRPDREGWLVHTDGEVIEARALVVATSAEDAARLLGRVAPVARPLHAGRTASIATILTAYERGAAEEALAKLHKGPVNGVMVPPHLHRLMKAATILSNKWPQAVHPELLLVRLSAGRVGQTTVARCSDDLLATRVQAEFAELIGLDAAPQHTKVVRWTVPQAEVGHVGRLRRIRNALAAPIPPIALAGAPYDGIGLGSVVTSGNAAASQIAHVVV